MDFYLMDISDKVIFDPHTQRLTHSALRSPALTQTQINRDYIVSRPDLSAYGLYQFQKNYLIAEGFLARFSKAAITELQKFNIRTETYLDAPQFKALLRLNAQLKSPFVVDLIIQSNKTTYQRCQLVNWFGKIKRRIYKMGLQFPLIEKNLTKQECLRIQNQTVQNLKTAMRPSTS